MVQKYGTQPINTGKQYGSAIKSLKKNANALPLLLIRKS